MTFKYVPSPHLIIPQQLGPSSYPALPREDPPGVDRSLFVVPSTAPVCQLICEKAFAGLTGKEKRYAANIAKAAWEGSKICLLQTSPESPPMFELLLRVFSLIPPKALLKGGRSLVPTLFISYDASEAVLTYAAAFLSNLGNYQSFGDTKIVPGCAPEDFDAVVECAVRRAARTTSAADAKDLRSIWSGVRAAVFSLAPRRRELGLGETGLSTYFSSNCDEADAALCQKFLDAQGISAYNTRLFKTGAKTYEVRVASASAAASTGKQHAFEGVTFSVVFGDHAPLMARVVENLAAAAKSAANGTQEKMLAAYGKSFRDGDIQDHVLGSTEWIKDKGPVVESYIGFIESYQDPAGTRGEWEGFVAVVNKETSAKFQVLVDSAEKLLPLLPWPAEFEKDTFQRPDFTSLEVLAFASSGIPAGINIPNYDSVRQSQGFKNVSLGNVLASSLKSKAGAEITFLAAEDMELYRNLVTESFEVQVGLHELLGHGSGKLFMGADSIQGVTDPLTGKALSTFYADGVTWDSKFGSLSSSYEECRAECVGCYLSTNARVLRIFGHADATADASNKGCHDITYCNWLHMARAGVLALQYYSPEANRWGQAHMQARYCILRTMLAASKGNNFVRIEKRPVKGGDGEATVVLMDRNQIGTVGMTAIGDFLKKIQIFKATAQVDAGCKMYNELSTVTPDMLALRAEVIARRKPRRMFVQPVLSVAPGGGGVELETFDATPAGIVQSFLARFPARDPALRGLWEAEAGHHSYASS